MNIEPRVPIRTADVSRGNTSRRSFLTNILLVSGFFFVLYLVLGWIAEAVVLVMPSKWEQAFQIPPDFSPWISREIPEPLSALFQKVCTVADTGITPTLLILEKEELNAFALPGGYVLVTRGLLEKVESEEELGFVLGHELAHLHHRDHLKHASRRLVFSLAIGLLFGSDSLAGSVKSLDQLQQLHYSRKQEMAADHLGLVYLNKAYGHVAGAELFFEKLQREGWAPSMLSTHPLPTQRIRSLEQWIRREGYAERKVTPWLWKPRRKLMNTRMSRGD